MNITSFVKFGMVGCSGIVVDLGVTWICREKLHHNKYLASATGFCCAVINNYFLNRLFTFNSREGDIPTQLMKFFFIALIGLFLSTVFIYLLQKRTKLNFYVSKVIVIGLVFFWNYGANSFYTFKYS